MVNFMCLLDWAIGCPIFGQTLLWWQQLLLPECLLGPRHSSYVIIFINVSCQIARFGNAHTYINQKKKKREKKIKRQTHSEIAGHELPTFMSQSVSFLPTDDPLFYFLFFHIWNWSSPTINLTIVGFSVFSIILLCMCPQYPGQVHWVCGVGIFPPTLSVLWQSEFLLDGKIFCISFHIL